jgi:hypothetical protein
MELLKSTEPQCVQDKKMREQPVLKIYMRAPADTGYEALCKMDARCRAAPSHGAWAAGKGAARHGAARFQGKDVGPLLLQQQRRKVSRMANRAKAATARPRKNAAAPGGPGRGGVARRGVRKTRAW